MRAPFRASPAPQEVAIGLGESPGGRPRQGHHKEEPSPSHPGVVSWGECPHVSTHRVKGVSGVVWESGRGGCGFGLYFFFLPFAFVFGEELKVRRQKLGVTSPLLFYIRSVVRWKRGLYLYGGAGLLRSHPLCPPPLPSPRWVGSRWSIHP